VIYSCEAYIRFTALLGARARQMLVPKTLSTAGFEVKFYAFPRMHGGLPSDSASLTPTSPEAQPARPSNAEPGVRSEKGRGGRYSTAIKLNTVCKLSLLRAATNPGL